MAVPPQKMLPKASNKIANRRNHNDLHGIRRGFDAKQQSVCWQKVMGMGLYPVGCSEDRQAQILS